MSDYNSDAEKCTESNERADQSDEPPVHELGAINHVVVEGDRVRLEGPEAAAEFGFQMPQLARAFAEAVLPDGYSVVRDTEVRG
ncbi:hypothetical protein [Halobaculum sp. P14]|uniref:hypothetical protein n=1 Tax=Halobaculum sp. P14 TaxID=3421638 RepID=UPI003EBF595A